MPFKRTTKGDDESAAAEHEAQRAAFERAQARIGRMAPYALEEDAQGTVPCRCGGSCWYEVVDPEDPQHGCVFACPTCLPQTAIRQAAGRYHPRMIGQVVIEQPPEQMAAF